MHQDDKICYCYGVSLNKLWHFARRRKLSRASQLSECLGAGTGCGWCIPFLSRIHEQAREAPPEIDAPPVDLVNLTPEEYAERRRGYIANKEPRNRF
jgi:bacterioferritin-associated ferredoxin